MQGSDTDSNIEDRHMDMNMGVRTSRSLTLSVLRQTRELCEGASNTIMMHKWRLHEVITLRHFCHSYGLVASLFHTDIGEPVAAFMPINDCEAMASVTRCGDTYLLIDREGQIAAKGESLFISARSSITLNLSPSLTNQAGILADMTHVLAFDRLFSHDALICLLFVRDSSLARIIVSSETMRSTGLVMIVSRL